MPSTSFLGAMPILGQFTCTPTHYFGLIRIHPSQHCDPVSSAMFLDRDALKIGDVVVGWILVFVMDLVTYWDRSVEMDPHITV